MTPLPRATMAIEQAIAERVFPGAVLEIGDARGATALVARGGLTYEPPVKPVTTETIYDLASLTKVLCTATLAARLVERGQLELHTAVAAWLPQWRGADRAEVTVRHLLDHSSGLPAHRPYFERLVGRDAYETAICAEPLEYAPGTRSVYSDAGFILLGLILERADGRPLDAQFSAWRDAEVPGAEIAFLPSAAWTARIAPTEQDAWRGRLLRGEVHDENCAAIGGVAGHAGLFGSAAAVGAIARWWLRAAGERSTYARFLRPTGVTGSSRALGWDTMRPTSSCGTRMNAAAVGHTGFTGTSLWIDLSANRYVVLLTNRVHPTRAGDAMARVRPAVHDAIADDLARG